MSRDVTFVLDLKGGEEILTDMVAPMIKQSTEAIAGRARGMASSMSSDPPLIETSTEIVPSKRGGSRVVGIVRVVGRDPHQNYIGNQALAKSKDAGRV